MDKIVQKEAYVEENICGLVSNLESYIKYDKEIPFIKMLTNVYTPTGRSPERHFKYLLDDTLDYYNMIRHGTHDTTYKIEALTTAAYHDIGWYYDWIVSAQEDEWWYD